MTSLAEILRSCGVFQPVFEDRVLDDLFNGLLQLPVSLFTTYGVGRPQYARLRKPCRCYPKDTTMNLLKQPFAYNPLLASVCVEFLKQFGGVGKGVLEST